MFEESVEEGEISSDGDIPPQSASQAAAYATDMTNTVFTDTSGAVYSPAFEWPGEDAPSSHSITSYPTNDSVSFEQESLQYTSGTNSSDHALPSLRLLVQNSAILSKKQKLAIIDGYTEVQIGRDAPPSGSETPKIRLKEMEVSKLHATIYWDTGRREWAVVDMGSKHGTFLQSNLSMGSSSSMGVRLSQSRMASIPRQIRHGDLLTMGGTTFLVHIHNDSAPCSACSPKGNDEISLFHNARITTANTSVKRKIEVDDTPPEFDISQRDPKKALTMLKRSLLSRHGQGHIPVSSSPSSQYIDRSAKRRAMHPNPPPELPASPHHSHISLASPAPPPHSPSPPVSAPPAPLPPSNIGHRLLMKQGWQPGTSLGQPESEGVTLLEPLDVSMNKNRAGLGMSNVQQPANLPSVAASNTNWKDAGKFRRWDGLRTNEHRNAGP